MERAHGIQKTTFDTWHEIQNMISFPFIAKIIKYVITCKYYLHVSYLVNLKIEDHFAGYTSKLQVSLLASTGNHERAMHF